MRKRPLVITEWLGEDTYKVYDVLNRTGICVIEDFKRYRTGFTLILDDKAPVYCSTETYEVIAPSLPLINLLDLNIDFPTMDLSMPWNKWEEKPLLVAQENISEKYKAIYKKAIFSVNINRLINMHLQKEYALLEYRLALFERLYMLSAPDIILDRQFDLLKTILDKVCII